jgi:hypothetical protein
MGQMGVHSRLRRIFAVLLMLRWGVSGLLDRSMKREKEECWRSCAVLARIVSVSSCCSGKFLEIKTL